MHLWFYRRPKLLNFLGKPAPGDDLESLLDSFDRQVLFQWAGPTDKFVGREPELTSLKDLHAEGRYVVLTGQRGIGKTELARKYADKVREAESASVVWIESSSVSSMVDAIKRLAAEVGVITEGRKITAVIRETFHYFKPRNTVFVFDAATKDNVLLLNLRTFLAGNEKSLVVVTSRDEGWNQKLFAEIKLEGLTKVEAVKYVKMALKDLDIPTDEATCELLAEKLKYLPLALNKSTGHILKKNAAGVKYTIADFIRQLDSGDDEEEVPPPPPVEDEIVEENLAEQIREETERIGEQVASGASEAWEKVSSGAKDVAKQVSHGANVAAKEISNAAKSVGHEVKRIFSGFG